MIRKSLMGSLAAATLSLGAAHAATTINAGGSSLAAPTYFKEFDLYHSTHPAYVFSYEAVGSGAGQKGFLTNDITQYNPPPAGTLTYGTVVGKIVDFGASDAFLSAAQMTNPAAGTYPLSSTSGPLIQLPTFGTPITIPYKEAGVTSTYLTLNDNQLCGIFSGRITDWHNILSSIAKGTTIHVAYRSDGSGTSFLLTQHLSKVCTTANSKITFSATTTFASLFPNSTPPANFTGESGSGNVATYLNATANSLGYLSPDYTSIAPKSASTTALKVAKITNAENGLAYLPNVANTETGLLNADPAVSTNAAPPANKTAAMNPLNWVPAVPKTTKGYPIVGYTTIDLSSCYKAKGVGTTLVNILKAHYTVAAYKTIITNNGFAPLANTSAAKYVQAVNTIFLTNSSGYNLNVDNATACAAYTGR